jgi:hypothetical protein
MTQPIRVSCADVSNILSVEEIRRIMDPDHHVVLQVTDLTDVGKYDLIAKLGSAMPGYSVFFSGGASPIQWVTIMPVVARDRVLSRLHEIRDAMDQYTETCSLLISKLMSGQLEKEWSSYLHGSDHRRFSNSVTGQEVEAPIDGVLALDEIDPYFFSIFVKSRGRFAAVADLIRHDFHDAKRMLEIVLSVAS